VFVNPAVADARDGQPVAFVVEQGADAAPRVVDFCDRNLAFPDGQRDGTELVAEFSEETVAAGAIGFAGLGLAVARPVRVPARQRRQPQSRLGLAFHGELNT